jgi:hypothetical protein
LQHGADANGIQAVVAEFLFFGAGADQRNDFVDGYFIGFLQEPFKTTWILTRERILTFSSGAGCVEVSYLRHNIFPVAEISASIKIPSVGEMQLIAFFIRTPYDMAAAFLQFNHRLSS